MPSARRLRMAKAARDEYAEVLEQYDWLIAMLPGVERKGATVPYTSLNGHMFSYLSKAGTLSLRLPEATRTAFLRKYKTRLCEQYGIVQKEYVEVPAALLGKTAELKPYFAESLSYVTSM